MKLEKLTFIDVNVDEFVCERDHAAAREALKAGLSYALVHRVTRGYVLVLTGSPMLLDVSIPRDSMSDTCCWYLARLSVGA